MKKILSLAIAAVLVAPVAAMADATVYGKVRLSTDFVNFDDNQGEDEDQVDISSHASRLGIKGSEDLGGGLKAIYKMEFGVDIAGKQADEFSPNSSDVISARNTYVGLAGGWGTFLVGRHDTPMKMSTGKLDYFADTIGDYNGASVSSSNSFNQKVPSAGFTDRRADGTLAYISPSFGGFTVAGATIPGENKEANGLFDAYSVAGMYSNGGLYLAAAYEAADGNIDALGGAVDVPGTEDDLSQWRVGGGYDFGQFRIAGVFENEKIDAFGGGTFSEWDKWNISGGWTLGQGEIKGTYFSREEDLTNEETTGFTIGYDYNFSKRTQLYALYNDSETEFAVDPDLEVGIFSIGMNHNF